MQWSLILLFMMAQCCFMDYQLYEFHYINENKTWTEAQQYCRENHTDLVTVTNMKNMKRLINISDGDQSEAWIGLYDQTHGNRTWFWSLPGVEFNESETNWYTSYLWHSNCGILRWLKTPKIRCGYHFFFLCYNETNTTHKYHLIKVRKTWLEAQSYCRVKHTDLISGTKQLQDAENMTIYEMSLDKRIYKNRPIYIGLFSDTWRWSDGNSSSFRHWNLQFDNEMTNSGQCAMTVFDDGGRWRNESCSVRKPFICYDDKVILIKENKTWHEALTHCRENYHHDLVTITNMDDQRWIQEKVKEASTDYVWIGLRYTCSRNVWFWVCDNWTWNEQNDCNMFGAMEAGGEHRWFQRNGSERLNFICTN